MTDQNQALFSHNPIWLVMCLLLETYIVYGMILLLRDPDVVSAKGLLVGVLFVTASAALIPLIRRGWRSSWTFTISDAYLVAVHQFLRTSHEIEWSSIVSVETLPQSFLAWGAARRFSCIVVTGGKDFLFAPHLQRYSVFLEELKTRAVNCRVFTPQIVPVKS